MARAIIYIRVSTGKQEANGDSLDVQERDCRADCAQHGHVVVAVESDTYTGHDSMYDRPGLARALKLIRSGDADLLMVKRVSRVTRDQADGQVLLHDVAESGGALRSVVEGMTFTGKADDKLLMGIYCFQAEKDWETIRAQSQDGLKSRVEKGRPLVSVALFGYLFKDGEHGEKYRNKAVVVVDEEAAPTVQFIFSQAVAGLSTHRITHELNRLGYTTPSMLLESRGQRGDRQLARTWRPEMVRHILRNESYTGRHGSYRTKATLVRRGDGTKRYKVAKRAPEDVVTLQIPALIDEAAWQIVQSQISVRHVLVDDAPLLNQGFALCGICETRMRAARQTGQTHASRYRVYRCRHSSTRAGETPCAGGHYVVKSEEVDEDIWAKVKAIIVDEPKWQRLVKSKSTKLDEEQAETQRKLDMLTEELSQCEAKQPKVYRHMEDEDDPEIKAMHRVELRRLNEVVAQLRKRIEATKADLGERQSKRDFHADLVAYIRSIVEHYRTDLELQAEMVKKGEDPSKHWEVMEGLVARVEGVSLDRISREEKRRIMQFMDVQVRMFPKDSEYARTHDTRWEFSWADAPSQVSSGRCIEA